MKKLAIIEFVVFIIVAIIDKFIYSFPKVGYFLWCIFAILVCILELIWIYKKEAKNKAKIEKIKNDR